ncbi:hypothetical protein MSAN_00385900 [Mycena sanguinolenta]|uniref:F-box domain-containing protein n=1 Tax=Mycena sanguinolenta TaxID=230812 RepID=A0A8H7DJV2_9AGAR|nr:hypothetical protein MSAN_00385900 [Mycena sanguinolenta]
MSRRSARLQGVAKAAAVEDTLSNAIGDDEFRDVEEDEEEIEVVPKKKRRRVAKSTDPASEDQKIKRVRGRRGILSSLREFPLDLIAEIFGHLNPLDLLSLARTTKEIRGILMSRSSAFIWKESRSHVEGLPDLPRDLCEPQYANLCFSTHCHQCLATPVLTIIWSARLRLCKKCIEAHFGNSDRILDETKLELIPLEALVPSYQDFSRGWRRAQELFSIDIAAKLSEECEAFREDGNLQTSDPKYIAWFAQKKDEMEEINAHAGSCAEWALDRTMERKNELYDARRLRREAIVKRLTALGWGEEIPLHTREFSRHKLVKQPKELTDRIWKNIEAPLVEFLTDLKEKRLVAARAKLIRERRLFAAQVYDKFREALPPDAPYPPKVEVLLTEPFRAVIEDTPDGPDQKLTEESFAAAILSLPEFIADWVQRKETELVEIMQKDHPGSVAVDLHLATTFFACSTYDPEPLRFPTILVHRSTTVIRDSEWDFDSLQRTLREEAWNADGNVRLHQQAQRNARLVVEACGLDPDVATSTEMDEINPALECLNCGSEGDHYVMRWVQATYHICRDWNSRGGQSVLSPSWKCLNADKEPLLEAEERKELGRSHYSNPFMHCKVCGDIRKMRFFQLRHHLLTEHNISDPSFEHFTYALEVGPKDRFPHPIRLNLHLLEAENIHTDEEAVDEVGEFFF